MLLKFKTCYLFNFDKYFIKTCLYYCFVMWQMYWSYYWSKIPLTLVKSDIPFLWRPKVNWKQSLKLTCLTRPVIGKESGKIEPLNNTFIALLHLKVVSYRISSKIIKQCFFHVRQEESALLPEKVILRHTEWNRYR